MKYWKMSLLLTTLVLLLTACEKSLIDDDSVSDSNDDATVVLKLSAYEQLPFGTRSTKDISALCSRLNVAFFQNSTKVSTVSQKEGDSDFGTVSLSLAEGTYQVVIIAHNCDGSATITSEEKVTFPSNIVSDTFCPLFGGRCTPEDPVGPCMVSSEGACAAAYKYQVL